ARSEPATRCETGGHRWIARLGGAGERARQIPRIAQAEVQSLPGDRMQGLRSIADVHLVTRHAGAAHLERERLHRAILDLHRPAGCAARDGGELREELALAGDDELAGALG